LRVVVVGGGVTVEGRAGTGGKVDVAGRGRWLANAPKLARVGVVASSRFMVWSIDVGAVLGRGVNGLDSSDCWLDGAGTSVVLTGRKEAIVCVVPVVSVVSLVVCISPWAYMTEAADTEGRIDNR
jgi:hypothetical protein